MRHNTLIKFCVVFLVICILSGSVCISAAAYGKIGSSISFGSDEVPPSLTLSQYVDTAELREYLFEAFKECNTERIQLSQFNLPVSVSDALRNFVWREMPECFQVDELRVIDNGKIIKAIAIGSFKYADTKAKYTSMLAECEKTAAVILDGIVGNDSLSDIEKALLIHDRFAVYCTYCTDESVEERYTMYGGLALGLAVCDGYTQSYSYLLRRAGIESINCFSWNLDHSWNIVYIDGKYYHVDVTWDDPSVTADTRSLAGHVMHEYFMLSDGEIKARKHNETDYYNTLAPDTTYDNYFWRDSEAEFQLVDGQIYYFDNETEEIKSLNSDKKSGTALYAVHDTWWASDRSAYYDGSYTRLSNGHGYLFFSTTDAIYLYDLKHGNATEIFRPERENGDPIYGFTYVNDYLICDTSDRPGGRVARINQIKQKYVPEGIFVKLKTEDKLQSSQTVTADISSNGEIKGYYFGNNGEFGESDIVITKESHFEFTVTEPGTYYFAAYSKNGEQSAPASLTFCLINLHTNGGSVSCDKILTEKGVRFVLPTPENNDLYFMGWAETENAESGKTKYEISDPPLTSDFYAIWKEEAGITCSVKTVKNDVGFTVTLLDENGDVINTVDAQPGEITFSVTEDTVSVRIGAPGYVKRTLNVDLLSNANIELTILGDTNNDTELNNKDVVILFRHVSGGETSDDEAIYDYNEDNEVNNKDVVSLFRAVSAK